MSDLERYFTSADVRAIVERYEADEDRGVRVNALALAMAEQEVVPVTQLRGAVEALRELVLALDLHMAGGSPGHGPEAARVVQAKLHARQHIGGQ